MAPTLKHHLIQTKALKIAQKLKKQWQRECLKALRSTNTTIAKNLKSNEKPTNPLR